MSTATAPAPAKRGRKPGYSMSAEHKANLAAGREVSRIVKNYLEALSAHQPKRGRKRTAETIEKRLAEIVGALPFEDSPIARLSLIAEKDRLESELRSLTPGDDLSVLEDEFVKVAADFSARKGITYAAWREVGVSADVLKRARIGRGVQNAA